jgi:hypothetical protein
MPLQKKYISTIDQLPFIITPMLRVSHSIRGDLEIFLYKLRDENMLIKPIL